MLGVDRLFWDDNDGRKGLLGEIVAEAVSWDEDSTIGHKYVYALTALLCCSDVAAFSWLPATKQLAPSAYSLSTLLSTPFSKISIIPDDRCVRFDN